MGIGVVKELTEKYKLAGKKCTTMFRLVKYAGIGVSILLALVFIIACITSKHIWDMFHVLRLNAFLCWIFGASMHIATDFAKVRDDPHINMLGARDDLLLLGYGNMGNLRSSCYL